MKSNAALAASAPHKRLRPILNELGQEKQEILLHDWLFWAHPAQIPPEGDWRFWLIMGGRGSGKTRAGAEWVRKQVESGRCGRLALVGPALADVREVMVGGESGLIAIAHPDHRPVYESSRRRLSWPNGAEAFAFSAEDPDSLRGPQFDAAWCDEFAAWPRMGTALTNLDLALRLGPDPRAVITTTPRPNAAMRNLLAMHGLALSRAATADNFANLAPGFLEAVRTRYGGTHLARQELDGDMLDDPPGAAFERLWIDRARIGPQDLPALERIVVGVDPPAGGGPDSDECGIVVAGSAGAGDKMRSYILADYSFRASGPEDWARKAMLAFDVHEANYIVAEANQGGSMVKSVLGLYGPRAAVRLVRAAQGKRVRAEPVALSYQRGAVMHVGLFRDLEDQMCRFGAPGAGGGDDRVDALVWALWALAVQPDRTPRIRIL